MAVSLVSTGVTFPDNSTQTTAATGFGFKNRIINGAMVIDQRNAGASVTLSSSAWTFPVDRFSGYEDTDGVMTAEQVEDAPTGFINSIKFTATTADASLGATQRVMMRQTIEGLNLADLAFGFASAATITISFWVKSSLTGTFGGSVQNGGGTRAYPFTYAISSANTWEQKSVTVAGDTSGTWLTTNGVGMQLMFGLGVGSTYSTTAGAWASGEYNSATGATSVIGTLNATWQISGVQLEKGSTATSFDYRPYGTELALCQRYYEKITTGPNTMLGIYSNNGAFWGAGIKFSVTKRSAPAMPNATSTVGAWVQPGTATYTASVAQTFAPNEIGTDWFGYYQTRVAGNTTPSANNSYMFEGTVTFTASSEL
jgi:hypothetical protein